jgi:hypothetical protein
MNTINMLNQKILIAYKDFLSLGYGHTLAACEYCDHWRLFPEDGIEGILDRGISVEEVIPIDFPYDVREEILWEIKSNKIVKKDYCFTVVESSYLERFCFGVPYLSYHEFNFYFCAWMLRYAEGAIKKESLINELFFSEIEGKFNSKKKSRLADTTHDQNRTIAYFLLYVSASELKLQECALECLNLGWEKFI